MNWGLFFLLEEKCLGEGGGETKSNSGAAVEVPGGIRLRCSVRVLISHAVQLKSFLQQNQAITFPEIYLKNRYNDCVINISYLLWKLISEEWIWQKFEEKNVIGCP